MSTNSGKYANDINNFRDWYNHLTKEDRKIFRVNACTGIWGNKKNPKYYFQNFIYGKSPVNIPVAKACFEISTLFDLNVSFKTLFPNIEITMENRIQKFLNREGITQAELAKELNMDSSQMNDYVNGKNKPSVYTAIRIAKKLSTTVEELFPDEGYTNLKQIA